MPTSEIGQQLHDRATRGEELSADDFSRLEQWYAEQDGSEAALLARSLDIRGNADLQVQVAAAVEQMMNVTQRIQTLIQENEAVRQETRRLQSQLIGRAST